MMNAPAPAPAPPPAAAAAACTSSLTAFTAPVSQGRIHRTMYLVLKYA